MSRHAFTPAGVREFEQTVREEVRRAVRECGRGRVDAADRLAWAVPVQVIARLLGADHVEPPVLAELLKRVIHRDQGSETVGAGAAAAARELGDLFADLAERRRTHPRADLMSDIVRAEEAGALRPGELRGLLILLFVAGTETVADFIGNALVVLHDHPDQRALLARDLARIPDAVEEILRAGDPGWDRPLFVSTCSACRRCRPGRAARGRRSPGACP